MKLKKLQKELKTELARANRASEILTEITAKSEVASKVFDEARTRLKEARKQAKLSKKKLRAAEKIQRAAKKTLKASKRRMERLEKKLQRLLAKSKGAVKTAAKPEPRGRKTGNGKELPGGERKAA